jgi:hypothetical protein
MRTDLAGTIFFDFNGLRCWAIVVLSFMKARLMPE